ncbi:hypothetical protein [Flavobacterium sp.]|uniref:hypothetical protein n=1 Tax=Flavobacterium sp. TaxID=239 RepID=UPI001B3DA62D|nr:hypothetical protein [Flavobacterium sp.]MBP6127352.1 hypothetical protein [Flavobacterium sp.]
MKKLLFILFIFVSLFSSCTEENAPVTETTNEPNKVLLLKVDYLTNTFQGGKETTYTENSNSFTISHQSIPAVDFGNIKLKYDEINQILFDGDIIWMGLGQIHHPQNMLTANQFEAVLTADIVFPSTSFNHILPQSNLSNNYNQVWMAVQNLVKVRQYLISNPTGVVHLYLYTPSVGVGNPADWKWIILMKN